MQRHQGFVFPPVSEVIEVDVEDVAEVDMDRILMFPPVSEVIEIDADDVAEVDVVNVLVLPPISEVVEVDADDGRLIVLIVLEEDKILMCMAEVQLFVLVVLVESGVAPVFATVTAAYSCAGIARLSGLFAEHNRS
mmetsp:Transcript_26368/g.60819  ORF Transcript_26368/g.60819 Transcript_26368/m.60819 type:complete len:136 (+) Transcript_26368:108-515(+)